MESARKLHLQQSGLQIVKALALNPNADISKLDLSRPGSCFARKATPSPRKYSRASSTRSGASSKSFRSNRSGLHSGIASTQACYEMDNFDLAAQ